jgi:hypothetical protein
VKPYSLCQEVLKLVFFCATTDLKKWAFTHLRPVEVFFACPSGVFSYLCCRALVFGVSGGNIPPLFAVVNLSSWGVLLCLLGRKVKFQGLPPCQFCHCLRLARQEIFSSPRHLCVNQKHGKSVVITSVSSSSVFQSCKNTALT